MNLREYLRLIRLKHWIKNTFVFFPLIFALRFEDLQSIRLALLAFLSFSLASSFVYVINDIVDRERDSGHPLKKDRPIASGKISIKKAVYFSLFILISALALSLSISLKVTLVLLLYIGLNIFYTFRLKHFVILDVMAIALGFVLRIVAGAYSIEVPVSGWIIVTTLALALFLGFAKRRHELFLLESDLNSRPVLQEYTVYFLDLMIIASVSLTIVFYSLYTMDPQNISRLGTDKLIYTVFFVVYGLFRYVYLIYRRNEGGDPADLVLKDRGLIITVVLWLLFTIIIIKGGF